MKKSEKGIVKAKKIEKGFVKSAGKFTVITRSHKSSPGDGTHGNGVKGGGLDYTHPF